MASHEKSPAYRGVPDNANTDALLGAWHRYDPMLHALLTNHSVTDPALLTKAVLRAAEHLQLQAALPDILGVATQTANEIANGTRSLDPQADEWQEAVRFVGMFRSLLTLVGSAADARRWLASRDHALGDAPALLLRTPAGRERVYRYLDAVQKYEIKLPPSGRAQ